MTKVGVTGGIGSGKSVVCGLFAKLGAPVYDSDQRAKQLMASQEDVISSIIALFGPDSYTGSELNRAYVAQKAFTNKELLEKLNQIVHPAVEQDFKRWADQQKANGKPYVILESAILVESGFHKMVDSVVCVTAPVELRIQRIVGRDGVAVEQIRKRVENQMCDKDRKCFCNHTIINDNHSLIVPQVVELDKLFRG